jgi:hypothetical protein
MDYYTSNPYEQLLNENWILFSMEGCGHCVKQAQVLQQYFPTFVNRKIGSSQTPNGQFISGFPSWYNTKTGYIEAGYKNKDALIAMIEAHRYQ